MAWNLDGAVEVIVEAAGRRGRKPADEVLAAITTTKDFGPYVSAKGAHKALTDWQAVAEDNGLSLEFSGIMQSGNQYGFRVTA